MALTQEEQTTARKLIKLQVMALRGRSQDGPPPSVSVEAALRPSGFPILAQYIHLFENPDNRAELEALAQEVINE